VTKSNERYVSHVSGRAETVGLNRNRRPASLATLDAKQEQNPPPTMPSFSDTLAQDSGLRLVRKWIPVLPGPLGRLSR
jgi:hypothetical protein